MFSNYPSYYSNAIPTDTDYKNTSDEWSSEDSINKYNKKSITSSNKKKNQLEKSKLEKNVMKQEKTNSS
jgi:hypothetical protein